MSYASKFFRLQQIDTQLDHILARLQELEILINDNTLLREAEGKLQQAENELKANQKALRQTEDLVQSQRIKISQNESSLYGGKIRNPKELQDLQSEVASQKKYLEVLEDRQLEAMVAAEDAEASWKNGKSGFAQVQATVVEQNAHLLADQTSCTQVRDRLEIERRAAENALPGSDLELYNQLRKIRNGVAVSKISERACSACGVNLTPAVVQLASSPTQITRCGSCGRILFPG